MQNQIDRNGIDRCKCCSCVFWTPAILGKCQRIVGQVRTDFSTVLNTNSSNMGNVLNLLLHGCFCGKTVQCLIALSKWKRSKSITTVVCFLELTARATYVSCIIWPLPAFLVITLLWQDQSLKAQHSRHFGSQSFITLTTIQPFVK